MAEPPAGASPAEVSVEAYDAVVIGGGLAGSSFAACLLQAQPAARVLVVERESRFGRKVGEATVEYSALFLERVLGLQDELVRDQLRKHGLRFWFSDDAPRRLDEMSELGVTEIPALATYQLDRAKLDESALERARLGGAELARPARVVDVQLGRPASVVRLESDSGPRTVHARWVIDASGRHGYLARRLDLRRPLREHPTHALWARWRDVRDMDGVEYAATSTTGLPTVTAKRRLATNHFCGLGWWCWVIPLAGGDTSIGLVYDERLFELPGQGPLRARFETWLRARPGLGELLASATIDGDDFLSRRDLAYRAERYADEGWALVGDAASFLDPFYSPGLDHLCASAYATAKLVARDLAGTMAGPRLAAEIERHNARFARSYERLFHALYRDKYELFGDAELVAAAYYLDTAFYFLGLVGPAHRDLEEYAAPPFGRTNPGAALAFWTMNGLRRRLVSLARAKRVHGTYGRKNVGWRDLRYRFGIGRGAWQPLRRGLGYWLRAEAERFTARFRRLHPEEARALRDPHSAGELGG